MSDYNEKDNIENSVEINNELTLNEENENNDPNKQRKPVRVSLQSFIVTTVALVLAAVMLTYTVCTTMYRKRLGVAHLENVTQGSVDAYGKLDMIRMLFEKYSYLGVDDEAMLDAVIKEYVSLTGDRYAVYYNADEYAEHLQVSSGNVSGIGINLAPAELLVDGVAYRALKITRVTNGSPAELAGVKPGDNIAWIGGADSATLVGDMPSYNAALEAMKDEKGSLAEFSVFREKDGGYEKLHFSIERTNIEVPSATGKVSVSDPKTGIVRISRFNSNTPRQFDKAIDDLLAAGCENIVFDLRGNPGGAVDSVVAILSRLLNEGDTLFSSVDANGTAETITVKVIDDLTGDDADCNVAAEDIGKYRAAISKMAVLCDGSSASAAELFAANIRDYSLGKIVGVKTYGKGSAQSVIPLAYFGFTGALRLTTKMYFSPSGEGYDGVGIYPTENYNVELNEEASKYSVESIPEELDNQLRAALDSFK